ncbi:hypothetical protein HPB50_002959 [Hyalomma asiaticum]|uniref:Uncharacterized protein n=1 Tax=Hyalomma asiaticum TaxID=266040 RepID=A0ACB7SK43_HYAAI|nr:hypothetical protein HPB50_002959 [Hyalomma asiaticum]
MAMAAAQATATINPPRRKSSGPKRPAAATTPDDSDSDGATAPKRTKNGDGGAPEHSDGKRSRLHADACSRGFCLLGADRTWTNGGAVSSAAALVGAALAGIREFRELALDLEGNSS